MSSISCAAAGECAAGGYDTDGSRQPGFFVVSETNGSWGDAIEVPGMATLNTGGVAEVNSISCAAAGECAAGGVYVDGYGTSRRSWSARRTAAGATRSRCQERRRRHRRRRHGGLGLVCRGRRVRRRRLLLRRLRRRARPSWSARRTAAGARRSRCQARRRSTPDAYAGCTRSRVPRPASAPQAAATSDVQRRGTLSWSARRTAAGATRYGCATSRPRVQLPNVVRWAIRAAKNEPQTERLRRREDHVRPFEGAEGTRHSAAAEGLQRPEGRDQGCAHT